MKLNLLKHACILALSTTLLTACDEPDEGFDYGFTATKPAEIPVETLQVTINEWDEEQDPDGSPIISFDLLQGLELNSGTNIVGGLAYIPGSGVYRQKDGEDEDDLPDVIAIDIPKDSITYQGNYLQVDTSKFGLAWQEEMDFSFEYLINNGSPKEYIYVADLENLTEEEQALIVDLTDEQIQVLVDNKRITSVKEELKALPFRRVTITIVGKYDKVVNISINNDSDNIKLPLDYSILINSVVSPVDATEPELLWTLANDGLDANGQVIATIDEKGKITGKNFGTTTLTVSSVSNSDIFRQLNVEVTNDIDSALETAIMDHEGVRIRGNFKLPECSSYDLTSMLLPEASNFTDTVTWTSEYPDVVGIHPETGRLSTMNTITLTEEEKEAVPRQITITATPETGAIGTIVVSLVPNNFCKKAANNTFEQGGNSGLGDISDIHPQSKTIWLYNWRTPTTKEIVQLGFPDVISGLPVTPNSGLSLVGDGSPSKALNITGDGTKDVGFYYFHWSKNPLVKELASAIADEDSGLVARRKFKYSYWAKNNGNVTTTLNSVMGLRKSNAPDKNKFMVPGYDLTGMASEGKIVSTPIMSGEIPSDGQWHYFEYEFEEMDKAVSGEFYAIPNLDLYLTKNNVGIDILIDNLSIFEVDKAKVRILEPEQP